MSTIDLSGISEREFQDHWVLPFATRLGWLSYHTFDSRRSSPGFPDLVLLKGGCMVVAELKSAKGRVTADQKMWLAQFERLAERSDSVSVHVWRPEDWPEIQEIFTRNRAA